MKAETMRAEALQAAAAAGGPAAELRSRRSAIGGGLGGGGPGGGGGAGGGAGEAQISLTIDVDVQKRKERDEQTTAIEQAISQLDSVFMQVRSLCRLCACIHALILCESVRATVHMLSVHSAKVPTSRKEWEKRAMQDLITITFATP